jgi:hypothetical protein
LAEDGVDAERKHPIWRFHVIDLDGPWGWRKITSQELISLHAKLVHLETMTWAEVSRTGSHFLSTVCREAMKRLGELNQDDCTSDLYSLRLAGETRVIGIRLGREFGFLWWDPAHQVCPSPKKHT